jgi:tripartite-type tricarboxylate transporter receptor subunit TctC
MRESRTYGSVRGARDEIRVPTATVKVEGGFKMKLPRRNFLHLAAGAAALPVSRVAWAQAFPARQITMIVPFPPGGSTDVTARVLAEHMRPLLGQPVIIENVGGAGGSIGVGRLARAAPDGYTIDLGQWDTHVGNIVYPLTYDLQKDFEPIGLVSINPQLMVARKNFPANDLKELVAWMKAHPGEAKFPNITAASQVSGLLLQQLTDTRLQLIPYRGAGPAMTDLISGQVLDVMVAQAAVTLPQVRGGTIKAIATLAAQRRDGSGYLRPRVHRATSSSNSTARWCRHSPILACALVLLSLAWTSPRASSRPRRASPPSTSPRSRNGGRSLRQRILSQND